MVQLTGVNKDISKQADKPANDTGKVSKPDEKKTEPADKPVSGNRPTLSIAQKNAILNLAARRSFSEEEIENKAVETFGCSIESLTPEDASSFIRELQKSS